MRVTKKLLLSLLVLLALETMVESRKLKTARCRLDSRYGFLIKLLDAGSARMEVDCLVSDTVTGCDPVGEELRLYAPRVARFEKCAKPCTCKELNARNFILRLKEGYPEEWQRVINRYSENRIISQEIKELYNYA